MPMPNGKEADGGVVEVPGVREGTTSTEPPARIVIARTPAAGKSIKVLKTYRIVLLGETKVGKSSLANAIFEEDVFKVKHSPLSGTRSVDGRRITLIETPDFFGKDRREEELRLEVGRCITASAPGPHAFFIVLKVERSPDHWKDAIQRISQYLPEAFNYAAVVFTHGDQLPVGMKIEEFVEQNKCLSDLVKKCGGRCHVVDNKYWKTNQQGDYRSNKVAELLNTTDKILMENKGGCYKMQRAVQTEIEKGGKRKAEGGAPQGDPSKSNNGVSKGTWIKLTGPAAKSLAGLFGPAVVVLQETEGKDEEEENKVEEEEEDEEEEEENKVEEEEEVVEEGEKKTEDEESDKKDETEKEKNAEDKKVTEQEKGKETEKKTRQEGAGSGGPAAQKQVGQVEKPGEKKARQRKRRRHVLEIRVIL
ncbi:uncharacterized protein LKV04_021967 [Tautogolabrus adspersus]